MFESGFTSRGKYFLSRFIKLQAGSVTYKMLNNLQADGICGLSKKNTFSKKSNRLNSKLKSIVKIYIYKKL